MTTVLIPPASGISIPAGSAKTQILPSGGVLTEVASGDTTAPTLSSPVGTATSASTATVGATTDEGNGTMYAIACTSATPPSVAQIQAGNDSAGAAAAWSGNQAISSTGAKTFGATGLTASTTYYGYIQHKDAAGNDSTVASSASFTTDAAATANDPIHATTRPVGGRSTYGTWR